MAKNANTSNPRKISRFPEISKCRRNKTSPHNFFLPDIHRARKYWLGSHWKRRKTTTTTKLHTAKLIHYSNPIIMDGIKPSTWWKWLKDHLRNSSYEANPYRVSNLGVGSDASVIFERLTWQKEIGVLTKTPFGSRLQVKFFFSSIGIPIMT